MAEEDVGEKTELPTDRRRQEMRERGNVVRSVDLGVAAATLATTAGLAWLGPDFIENLAELLKQQLSQPAERTIDLMGVSRRMAGLVFSAITILAGWFLLQVFTAVAINLAQVGFMASWEPVTPQWSRINPISGLGRLFSTQSVVRLAGSALKLTVLGLLAYGAIGSHLETALGETDMGVTTSAERLGGAMVGLAISFSIALGVLAVMDYGYQYWKFEQDLLMTKQEIRDEFKEMEGDPQIRQQRRDAHRKLAQSKQMNAVTTADALVTNPTQIAVAIKYDEKKMAAPIVVAKGMNDIAARMRQIAAEHGVPIIERKPLARALYRDVKVGRPVPEELYGAVAEIMAYVYRLSGKDKLSQVKSQKSKVGRGG
jgi:flagellar biosynthetic protein FlhB